ncbi:thiamine pyrophosphate-dependent enzyme [Streptomyces sp. NPDC096153]|uniref:thiamine pyrophosphate-binding protein n=1 Tax=Streptomyces sp. NPDC096153 TaxID=3155548 RepID=UPI00331BA6B1
MNKVHQILPASASVAMGDFSDIVAALRHSGRPLFFLGAGARDAMARYADTFTSLAEKLNVPVATSVRGKGIFPESHHLSLGVFGLAGSAAAREYVESGIDTLVVIGSRLGEWATGGRAGNLAKARRIIHVDMDPSVFGQVIPAHHVIVGDAADFMQGLHAAAERFSPSAHPVERKHVSPSRPVLTHGDRAGSPRMAPSLLINELSQCLQPGTDVFVDMGNCTAWAARDLVIDPPSRIFIPTGLASMGWSCGAVIGGKIARPDRRALALVGDGAFLMNGSEVATAARQRVGAVYLVLDDGYLGTVNHGESWQTGSDLNDSFYAAGADNLPGFASALGAHTVRITSAGQLRQQLPKAFDRADEHGIPQVLVAAVDHLEAPPYNDRFTVVAGDR